MYKHLRQQTYNLWLCLCQRATVRTSWFLWDDPLTLITSSVYNPRRHSYGLPMNLPHKINLFCSFSHVSKECMHLIATMKVQNFLHCHCRLMIAWIGLFLESGIKFEHSSGVDLSKSVIFGSLVSQRIRIQIFQTWFASSSQCLWIWMASAAMEFEVMVKRDRWGHSYCSVRGEILGLLHRQTTAKAFTKNVFKNQEWKHGVWKRLHRYYLCSPCHKWW